MNTKTHVMILQELMVRRKLVPIFNFSEEKNISNEFECIVTVDKMHAIGRGLTKKTAKQNAAELILKQMMDKGTYFPNPEERESVNPRVQYEAISQGNNVGGLKDLCSEYSIRMPVYECLSEAGPPHNKLFTVKCTTGSVERTAEASTKKYAKQLAAGKILEYFKKNIPQRIADIADENTPDEISQLNKIAIDNYCLLANNRRPNLGLKISEYHIALRDSTDAKKIEEVNNLLSIENYTRNPVAVVEKMLNILELEFSWGNLPSITKSVITFLKVPHATPPIFCVNYGDNENTSKQDTAARAIEYIKLKLNIKC